jgi:zinc D-Ala-D-Ala carboxypeptidase|tara:strand:+ start:7170 stop:7538 length:369 start_codon:yes stop_codon:yes gene_type:complete
MKYFTLQEFDSPDKPGSGKNMDKDFLEMLDCAREEAQIPFKINSGFRTEAKNKEIYRLLRKTPIKSSHLKGYAADIHCNNSQHRSIIVRALINVGFTRLGIAATFIHVDNDQDKLDAIWLYS